MFSRGPGVEADAGTSGGPDANAFHFRGDPLAWHAARSRSQSPGPISYRTGLRHTTE